MIRNRLALLLTALALPLHAADDTRRTQPVHLRADQIELDQKTGASVYRGNVVFAQADFRLTAAQATTASRAGQLQTVTARGKPLTFRDRVPGQLLSIEGSAERAEFEVPSKQLHLFGNVDIRRGEDRFRAAAAHYDQNDSHLIAESDGAQRVRATLKPHQRAPASREKKP